MVPSGSIRHLSPGGWVRKSETEDKRCSNVYRCTPSALVCRDRLYLNTRRGPRRLLPTKVLTKPYFRHLRFSGDPVSVRPPRRVPGSAVQRKEGVSGLLRLVGSPRTPVVGRSDTLLPSSFTGERTHEVEPGAEGRKTFGTDW